jgi:hypothetical protein
MDVLAGADSFTVEVLSWRGLVTYYVLFFIHLESRRVSIAGITDHPEACWMRQMACNATLEGMGDLNGCRYVLHVRDRPEILPQTPQRLLPRPWLFQSHGSTLAGFLLRSGCSSRKTGLWPMHTHIGNCLGNPPSARQDC